VARSPAKTAQLEALGARPCTVDLFDPEAVARAVSGHDVVVNLATHIPNISRAALPGSWAENDRIRSEASRNLADGARAGDVGRYVQESITFLYPDSGDRWLDEETPLEPARYVRSVVEAEGQAARFTQWGGTGVVLRFAVFYGPDSHHTVEAIRAARKRVALQPGRAGAYLSSIHTDDAARAVVAALTLPAGIYNVADDEPVTRQQYADALARAVGVPSVRLLPRPVTALGGKKLALLARSQRVSNRRLVEASGWAPAVPSIRSGLPAVGAEVGAVR
jgi:nucleoside-diphosphate-sugar epimerase